MKPELFWLTLTASMTALFWIPYVLNRFARLGILGTLATPRMDAPAPEAEWAQRARRAHSNATENLVVFTALVAVAQFAGVSNGVTALAAALFFWGRLAHFLAYSLGIPYARTLAFTVAWIGVILMAWQILFAR